MDNLRSWQIAPGIVRVWHDPQGAFDRLPDPALGDWGRAQRDGAAHTSHSSLGELAGILPAVPIELGRDDAGHVRVTFPLAAGERIYGAYDADALGLDRRCDHVHLMSDLHPRGAHPSAKRCRLCKQCSATRSRAQDEALDMRDPLSMYGEMLIPFVISSAGYAVYVSNLAPDAVIDLGLGDAGRWSFTASTGHADIYVLGPDDLPGLVRTWHRLSGRAPLPPAWALGFIQSRFGYESFDHALGVARRFRDEALPAHALVFDVQWLEDHVNLRWDPQGFPDPESHLAELASLGMRAMVITEPGTREDASNFASGRAVDAWATTWDGDIYDADQWYADRGIPGYRELARGRSALLNVFRESVNDWWYEQHRPLLEQGVDAWWLDLNEPEDVGIDVEFRDTDWPAPRTLLAGTDAHNLFAIAQQRAFARRDRAYTDRRPFMLSRSASAGSQRYGAAPWSGDVGATWKAMRQQPRLGLTAGLCGMPLWGCDVGGFHGDPGPELFTRWMQMGSMMPIFRAHGSMEDREPWSQGAQAMEAIRPALTLRAQLLPSIVTWARRALLAGEPLMRPMLWDHPDDSRFHDCEDQWYFGPLLVAPVMEEGAGSRRVILPPGDWVDVWTGACHSIGSDGTIDVAVTSSTLPIFLPRSQALVVDGAPLDRRGRNWPPPSLEVWSWAGEEPSHAQLYSDDGITREHEEGAYCELQLSVRGCEVEATRIAGAWPIPSLRVVDPHPGVVAVAHAAGGTR